MSHVYFLIETLFVSEQWDGHITTEQRWTATYQTIEEATEHFNAFSSDLDCVSAVMVEWTGEKQLAHGNLPTRNCSGNQRVILLGDRSFCCAGAEYQTLNDWTVEKQDVIIRDIVNLSPKQTSPEFKKFALQSEQHLNTSDEGKFIVTWQSGPEINTKVVNSNELDSYRKPGVAFKEITYSNEDKKTIAAILQARAMRTHSIYPSSH